MSQSPQTGQVYFNIVVLYKTIEKEVESHNPLKRVKFISIDYEAVAKKLVILSQSPQTGQVYFNPNTKLQKAEEIIRSQSPQTGQVYFNAKLS